MKKPITITTIILPLIFAFLAACDNLAPSPELLPPSSVKAELSGDEFHITWEIEESDYTYEVLRKTGESGYSVISLNRVNEQAFIDTDYPPDCALQYTVRSTRGTTCSPTSPPSNVVSRFILNLKASRLEYTDRIVVSWSAYEGAAKYMVYRYEANSPAAIMLGQPSAYEFVDIAAVADTPYFYRVSWIENNIEKGTGGPVSLGIYSDQKDFYEPNNDYKDIESQQSSSVFNPDQPPLVYSFGDADGALPTDGNIYADTDWYKYVGSALPVRVTIALPDDSLFADGELQFAFFYNNTTGLSLPVNRGTNRFLFDNFGSVQGNVSLSFKVFPSVASTRQVLGTYTVSIGNGL